MVENGEDLQEKETTPEVTITDDAAAWLDGKIGSWEFFGRWDEGVALAEAKEVAITWPYYSYPHYEYPGDTPEVAHKGLGVDSNRWLDDTMDSDEYFHRARQRARIIAEVSIKRQLAKRRQQTVKAPEDEVEEGLDMIREQIRKYGKTLIGRWRR